MRRYSVILLLLLLAPKVWSQANSRLVDSLLTVLPTQQGSEKVHTMLELTWELCDISFTECVSWGENAIVEAQNIGNDSLVAKANYVLGMQYCYHGDLDFAKEYLNKSCQICHEIGNWEGLFDAQWQKARFEQAIGNLDSSFAYYEDALPTSLMMHDSMAYSDVKSNMAVILYDKGDLNQSKMEFLHLRDFYHRIGNDAYLLPININLATIEMESGNPGAAKSAFRSLISQSEDQCDNYHLMLSYKNLGTIYLRDFINYDSALICLQNACRYSELVENNYFASEMVDELGDAYFVLGNYKEAIRYYEEGLAEATEVQHYTGMAAAYAGMGQVYYKLGQVQKSLECYQKCFESETKMGSEKYHMSLNGEMVKVYARLGRYDDMESELDEMEEDKKTLVRENASLFDECLHLQDENVDLIEVNQSQDNRIEALSTRVKHYQLAFFGLLGAVVVVILLALLKKPKR